MRKISNVYSTELIGYCNKKLSRIAGNPHSSMRYWMASSKWNKELPTLQSQGKKKTTPKLTCWHWPVSRLLNLLDSPRFYKVNQGYPAWDLKVNLHVLKVIRHPAGIIIWFRRPVLGYYRASARLKECQYAGVYLQSTFNTFNRPKPPVNIFKEWRDFGKQNLQNER